MASEDLKREISSALDNATLGRTLGNLSCQKRKIL